MGYDLHRRVLPNHGANAELLGDAATPIRIGLHPIQTFAVEERLNLPARVVMLTAEPNSRISNLFQKFEPSGCFSRRRSCQRVIDLADGINDIVVDPLGIFRADADLDETVENIQRLPTTVRAIFDFLPLRAVK